MWKIHLRTFQRFLAVFSWRSAYTYNKHEFIPGQVQHFKLETVCSNAKAQCKYIQASPSVATTFKRHMSQCTNYIEVKAHCRPGGRAETTLEWHHWEQESPRPTECVYSNLLDENE